MLAVDRELAEHGLLDPSTCLFRSCHICVLQLPDETCPSQVWLCLSALCLFELRDVAILCHILGDTRVSYYKRTVA